MNMNYRKIISKFGKANLLHRINLQKISIKNGLYLGQLPILEYITENDGCTQKEIAEFMCVSPPSIATSVKRMELSGLIDKKQDKSDQRYNRLTITEKGRNVARKCRMLFDEVDSQLFNGMSKEECDFFEKCLEKMISNLSNDKKVQNTMFSLIEQSMKLQSTKLEEDGKKC